MTEDARPALRREQEPMRHRWFWRIVTLPLVALCLPLGLVLMTLEWLAGVRAAQWAAMKMNDAWFRR
jgi:hypothetical protein